MAWGRGLLRLWVVLSVIWIGLIAAVTVIPPLIPTQRERDRTHQEIIACEAMLPEGKNPFDCYDPIAEVISPSFEPENWIGVIQFAAIPPLLLLALGWAIVWTVAGFLRSRG